jgi:hypothetical protein
VLCRLFRVGRPNRVGFTVPHPTPILGCMEIKIEHMLSTCFSLPISIRKACLRSRFRAFARNISRRECTLISRLGSRKDGFRRTQPESVRLPPERHSDAGRPDGHHCELRPDRRTPRFHQLDVVRKLLSDEGQGAGRRVVIQHSAGSGKSASIAWRRISS